MRDTTNERRGLGPAPTDRPRAADPEASRGRAAAAAGAVGANPSPATTPSTEAGDARRREATAMATTNNPCWCGRTDGTPHANGVIGHDAPDGPDYDTPGGVLAEAARLGRAHGKSAGSWFEADSEAAARHVLAALDDPGLDDAIAPPAWLSGEWADDPTPDSLARELGIGEPSDPDNPAEQAAADADAADLAERACDAYTEAADAAWEAEVRRICAFVLDAPTEGGTA